MTVSIIVPVYNCERHITECIDSILSQTYQDIDVVVVDDGSTDQSSVIIKSLARKDSRITYIRQSNQGVSAARNKGLSIAKGEYVMFVDADDYLNRHDAVSQVVQVVEDGSPDIIQYKKVGATGAHPNNPTITRAILGGMIVNETLNTLWDKAYDLSIIKQHSIIFPKGIRMGEDLLFNAQYFEVAKSVRYLDQELYFYREDNVDSATKKYMPNKYDDLMQVNKELASIFDRSDKKIKNALNYIRIKNVLSCMRDLYNKDCPMTPKEKLAAAKRYKNENGKLYVNGYGVVKLAISIVYSWMSGGLLYRASGIIGDKK